MSFCTLDETDTSTVVANFAPAANTARHQATPSHIDASSPVAPGHNRLVAQGRSDRLHPDTIAAQAGGNADDTTGGLVPPIHVSSTFVRDADNQYRRGYCYGRADNATVRQVESVLTELEGGAATLLLGSGMAAATTVFLALKQPAHVIAPTVMYWGLRQWLVDEAPRHGLQVTFVDAETPAALKAAMRPGHTRLVWIETPSNPLWTITDIVTSARIAHDGGALLAVDSTVSTPVLTRPLSLGADLVSIRRRSTSTAIPMSWPGLSCSAGWPANSMPAPSCAECSAVSLGLSKHRSCCGDCEHCTCVSATKAQRQ